MSDQANLLLERDSITMNEFDILYRELMNRTWQVFWHTGRNEIQHGTFNLMELGWTMKYDTAKKRLGVCRRNRFTGMKEIAISKALLKVNIEGNAKEFEDTVRHEIAHAIDHEIRDVSDHGQRWKHIAKQVGANPEPCKSVNSVEHKWTGTCPNCKKESYRHALRGNAKYGACSRCCSNHNGGRYTEAYKLKWTKNF